MIPVYGPLRLYVGGVTVDEISRFGVSGHFLVFFQFFSFFLVGDLLGVSPVN